MTVKLTWDSFGVLCVYEKNCTVADVMVASSQIRTSPDAAALSHCIHDFTKAETIEDGAIGVATIAGHFGQRSGLNSEMRVALVVNEADAASSNVYIHASAASRPTKVFKTLTAALDWLGDPGAR